MAIVSNLIIDQGTTFKADIDVTDTDGNVLHLVQQQILRPVFNRQVMAL